jgi:hypothetical protein
VAWHSQAQLAVRRLAPRGASDGDSTIVDCGLVRAAERDVGSQPPELRAVSPARELPTGTLPSAPPSSRLFAAASGRTAGAVDGRAAAAVAPHSLCGGSRNDDTWGGLRAQAREVSFEAREGAPLKLRGSRFHRKCRVRPNVASHFLLRGIIVRSARGRASPVRPRTYPGFPERPLASSICLRLGGRIQCTLARALPENTT